MSSRHGLRERTQSRGLEEGVAKRGSGGTGQRVDEGVWMLEIMTVHVDWWFQEGNLLGGTGSEGFVQFCY